VVPAEAEQQDLREGVDDEDPTHDRQPLVRISGIVGRDDVGNPRRKRCAGHGPGTLAKGFLVANTPGPGDAGHLHFGTMTVEVAGDVRPRAIVDCLPFHRARYAASRAVALSLALFVAACSSDPDRPAGWTWPDAGVAGAAGLAWSSEG